MASRRTLHMAVVTFLAVNLTVTSAHAEKLILHAGRILEGLIAPLGSVAESPLRPKVKAGAVKTRQIMVVDDDLRRTFVGKHQIANLRSVRFEPAVRIKIPQAFVAESGPQIHGVGPIMGITPFDEYGRRVFSMMGPKGRIDIIQAITEVTPNYTKIQALRRSKVVGASDVGSTNYVWDMRIATSSIPVTTLRKIFRKMLDQNDSNARIQIARFFIASDRYREAREELRGIVKDFPHLKRFEREVQSLRETGSRRILEEIERRQKAGQYQLVHRLLTNFPRSDIAGETLGQIGDMIQTYDRTTKQAQQTIKMIDEHIAALEDAGYRDRMKPVRDEIAANLNRDNFNRLAAYRQLVSDTDLKPDEKLALATSGWLLGSNSATQKLPVALSMYTIRNLVGQYMRADTKVDRRTIMEKIQSQEGAVPALVAKLLAHMTPPIPTEPQQHPGSYELMVELAIADEPPMKYLVELPPEYNPYRRYPAVVSMHGAGTDAALQIDWWAGKRTTKNRRFGQAGRHGFIVIAPMWAKPHQKAYEYSAREHLGVLAVLRDAMRRFSIDTDRVFLSGHSMGGDAAWDISLAHPDVWAGVIPIVAQGDKYVKNYWENARQLPLPNHGGLPMYFVAGEFDGGKMVKNATELDRYLTRPGFDVTVVEYLGRGHEHFQDELIRIFEWMQRKERNFFPKEFAATTTRVFDNFYWWLEIEKFTPAFIAGAGVFPPKAKLELSGKRTETNSLRYTIGKHEAILWLSPDIVDFAKPIQINGRRREATPSIKVMLEDVRTRGDRQHPFWAKLEA
ncbi:MAG: peptidase [Pirellulales bacterium]|nr:peptidase [Pirellulales bacterium]